MLASTMKASHLNFIFHWINTFLKQGKHISNAAVLAEENGWSVKAIPPVRVQKMESQQDKQHLQTPAGSFSKPENNLQTGHSLHCSSSLNVCSKCFTWREEHCNLCRARPQTPTVGLPELLPVLCPLPGRNIHT